MLDVYKQRKNKASSSKKVKMYLEQRQILRRWRIDVLFVTPRCGQSLRPLPRWCQARALAECHRPSAKKKLHKQFDIRRQEFTSLFNTLNSRALVAIGSTCWSSLEQKKKVHIS
jgi:hypothetical protein